MPKNILLFLFLALPNAASSEAVTPYLLEFGNARSQLWGVLTERPKGGGKFAFAMADRLALNPERKIWPFRAATVLSFNPIIKFDRNVNNGFKGDKIYIFDLPFTVDEESRAVEAVTIGGGVSGGISFGIAQGTTLTFSGRSEYQRAIGEKFEVFSSTAAVNLGYTTQNWTYANAGFLLYEEKRALAEETTKIASWTIGKMFGEGGSHLHDVSGSYIRAEEEAVWQSRARVDWTGSFANHGVFKIGLERGEGIELKLLPRTAVNASYSNVIYGQPTTVSASYTEKKGGTFFGSARNDRIYRIRADRRLNDRFSIYLAAERKESSISSFEESGIDIGFNIRGFRF